MQEALQVADPEHRYQLIERLCQIYTVAQKEAKLAGVKEDLEAFAFQWLPPLLAGQTNHYGSILNRVSHTLHDLAGVRLGLKFLIERLEQEPAWLRYSNQDGWSQHGGTLSVWRAELQQSRRSGAAAAGAGAQGAAPRPVDAELSQPPALSQALRQLLGGEGRGLRPRGRGRAGPAQGLGRVGEVHRPLLRRGTGSHGSRRRRAAGSPHPRRAGRSGHVPARGLSASAGSLSGIDRAAGAADGEAAGEPGVPRVPDAGLLQDQSRRAACQAAGRNGRLLPPGQPLDGGRAGSPGRQLPGQPALRAERDVLQGADPAARADAAGPGHRPRHAVAILRRICRRPTPA